MSIFPYPLVIINDSFGVRSIYWNRSGSVRLLSIVLIESHWNEFKCKTNRVFVCVCVREKDRAKERDFFLRLFELFCLCDHKSIQSIFHALHLSSIAISLAFFSLLVLFDEKNIVVYYKPNCIRLNWWKSLKILMVQLIISLFVCRHTVEI